MDLATSGKHRNPPENQWAKLVRENIHEREEKDWLQEMRDHSKLRTYVTLKRKLEREKYLEVRNRFGAPELTKLRGGSNRLRIETGRWSQFQRKNVIVRVSNSKGRTLL